MALILSLPQPSFYTDLCSPCISCEPAPADWVDEINLIQRSRRRFWNTCGKHMVLTRSLPQPALYTPQPSNSTTFLLSVTSSQPTRQCLVTPPLPVSSLNEKGGGPELLEFLQLVFIQLLEDRE